MKEFVNVIGPVVSVLLLLVSLLGYLHVQSVVLAAEGGPQMSYNPAAEPHVPMPVAEGASVAEMAASPAPTSEPTASAAPSPSPVLGDFVVPLTDEAVAVEANPFPVPELVADASNDASAVSNQPTGVGGGPVVESGTTTTPSSPQPGSDAVFLEEIESELDELEQLINDFPDF